MGRTLMRTFGRFAMGSLIGFFVFAGFLKVTHGQTIPDKVQVVGTKPRPAAWGGAAIQVKPAPKCYQLGATPCGAVTSIR